MVRILSIEDNSTGIATRRRSSAVLEPADWSDIERVAVDVMKATIRSGVECLDTSGRLHLSRFHADVGFVNLFDDTSRPDAGRLVARAVYVRKGLDKHAVPMLPKGRVRTLKRKMGKGTMTLAIERETT